MEEKDLLDLLDIKPNEIDKAKHFFAMKGVDLHFSVVEYLSSFTSNKIKYCEVATVIRYDKRIRKTLYKYIGLLEEYLRAFLCNKYSSDISLIELIPKFEKAIENEGTLFKVLEKAHFVDLLNQVLHLSLEDKKNLFPRAKINEANLMAVNDLRNAVSHNRFLLNYRDFKVCNIGGEKKSSLLANLIVFSSYLPPEIRKSFFSEIDECQEQKENKNPTVQTEWSLPQVVVIRIENQ